MTAPEQKYDDVVFDAIDIGLILLDADRRVVGWNVWMEAASGISRADCRGPASRRICFPATVPPRLTTAISHALELGASGLVTHSLHSSDLPAAHARGAKAPPQHFHPPARQPTEPRMPAADRRCHRRRRPRTHPARAPERALRCRCRRRPGRDPDARCGRRDPAGQSGGGARIRLRLGRTHRPVDGLPARAARRVEQGLQRHPRRRRPSAGRSSSRPAARTERRATSRPRRRAGRARAAPSSRPSCATSTSGAWPSTRCAC